jgi:hypothetical protein
MICYLINSTLPIHGRTGIRIRTERYGRHTSMTMIGPRWQRSAGGLPQKSISLQLFPPRQTSNRFGAALGLSRRLLLF